MNTCKKCKKKVDGTTAAEGWHTRTKLCDECFTIRSKKLHKKADKIWRDKFYTPEKRRESTLRRRDKIRANVRNYQTNKREDYQEYQRTYHKNMYASSYAYRLSHAARMQIVRARKGLFLNSKHRSHLGLVVMWVRRLLSLKNLHPDELSTTDKWQFDHIIPLIHLTRFIEARNIPKNQAIKIINSPQNIDLISSEENRNKYDLINNEAIRVALILEDAFPVSCEGLVPYLQLIQAEQIRYKGTLSHRPN